VYCPTPTENGVPHGTETSTGVNPGKTNLHLHSDGTPITPCWLDELVETLDFDRLEELIKLEDFNDETKELRLEEILEAIELDKTGTLELIDASEELVAGIADETLVNVTLELVGAI
jgi:hypothetical protein